MKRRMVLFFSLLLNIITIDAQDLQNLESNPSFKGIRIGMPISEIKSKLSFDKINKFFTIYKLTDPFYYSVFNIKMSQVYVIALNDKIYGIEAKKEIKSSEENPKALNIQELLIIESGLKEIYGSPTHQLSEKGDVVCMGKQWNSKTKQASIYINYYGAFQGYDLFFILSERHIDF